MKINLLSNKILLAISLGLLMFSVFIYRRDSINFAAPAGRPKVYWFVPDGFRADHDQFNIFKWAENGELPNLKKMMENGCRGYSWPVFPGHTPTNFATLMTGVNPDVHGIADGPMRVVGYPLDMVVKGGFSSFAKKVPPLWVQLEKTGSLVSLQSIPGSTPPELFNGNTIKGRWGAWGIDFPAIVFQDKQDKNFVVEIGQNKRLFTLGSDLTHFENSAKPKNWNPALYTEIEKSSAFEIDLTNWSHPLYGLADGDKMLLSSDKKEKIALLPTGAWSDWLPVTLKYQLKNDYQKNSPKKTKIEQDLSAVEVDTFMKIKIIRLGKSGEFRIRIIYDNLNEFLTSPASIADDMRKEVGHMTDFVDNYPPQLIFYPQDKQTFIEEADLSWEWHRHAIPYLIRNLKSDIVIHSIYTPNQMLTSRWWLPFIDKNSYRYNEKTDAERAPLVNDVKKMYQQADAMLGEIMKNTDQNWYVILSSDHGAVPLYREVRLNNLFASRGWLKYKFNEGTQEFDIDWENTKVVYLQMNNIYINPKGLAGVYQRSATPEYYQLRDQVQKLINELEDPETHLKIAHNIWPYEKASEAKLPQDRVGDLIVSNEAQYNWSEDVSDDRIVFAGTKKGGYKQGVWPESTEAMLTPFVIMGPDIKKGCVLSMPIRHVDQFATISKILSNTAPYPLNGRVLTEIFK